MLPLSENIGSWILQNEETNEILGLLWAMKLSETRCRVLAFSITSNLQGRGLGSAGWELFEKSARQFGFQTIQLEVRRDNYVAIEMYRRRGLKPKGRISGYYRGHDGWLMLGTVR